MYYYYTNKISMTIVGQGNDEQAVTDQCLSSDDMIYGAAAASDCNSSSKRSATVRL